MDHGIWPPWPPPPPPLRSPHREDGLTSFSRVSVLVAFSHQAQKVLASGRLIISAHPRHRQQQHTTTLLHPEARTPFSAFPACRFVSCICIGRGVACHKPRTFSAIAVQRLSACASKPPGPGPSRTIRQKAVDNRNWPTSVPDCLTPPARKSLRCAPCTSGLWKLCCFGFTFLLRCYVSAGGGSWETHCTIAPLHH